METEETRKKNCFRCSKFNGYYTKGDNKFNRAKYGFCREKLAIVENCEDCEYWDSDGGRRYASRRAVKRALNELLTQITAIRQIFEEAQGEE